MQKIHNASASSISQLFNLSAIFPLFGAFETAIRMAQAAVPVNMILVCGALRSPPSQSDVFDFRDKVLDFSEAEFLALDFRLLRAVAKSSGLLIRCAGGFSRFRSNIDRGRQFRAGRLCGPMVAVL